MSTSREGERVPAHLRRFVVEQDYAEYTPMDQAVWRFVLLQTHARLADTAHPVYREGLAATGISVERIPRIAAMNERLARFGWGAVCVDGFIPPRAFQEFQAAGLLPIAGAIRTRQHLAYTPAPDIIHEAAGHAPILPEPVFAAYLRRIGELGAQAFTAPEEGRVFRAIYVLSEIKEAPGANAADVAAAEVELEAAIASVPEPSEAARLSRLYWWTAEYGLLGRPNGYAIYGAGLLSSLGESHSCHAPGVRKRVLDESCIHVGYDITRPQPQLFVAPSFEALHDVLDRVAGTLAVRIGGAVALGRALASQELASVGFSSGAWVMGTLGAVEGAAPESQRQPAWLRFDGSVAFAWDREGRPPERGLRSAEGQLVLTGRLDDGSLLAHLDPVALAGRREGGTDRHRFGFVSGAVVEGRLESESRHTDGRLMQVELGAARVTLPGHEPALVPRFVLLATGDVTQVRAGAADPTFRDEPEAATPPASPVRIPRPRDFSASERRLIELCARAERAHRGPPGRRRAVFSRTHAVLTRDYPDEWLMRWNLLESLRRHPAPTDARAQELEAALVGELERLEVELEHREPIASGLRYLDAHRAAEADPRDPEP